MICTSFGSLLDCYLFQDTSYDKTTSSLLSLSAASSSKHLSLPDILDTRWFIVCLSILEYKPNEDRDLLH